MDLGWVVLLQGVLLWLSRHFGHFAALAWLWCNLPLRRHLHLPLQYCKSKSVGNRGSGASQPHFPTFSKKPAKFNRAAMRRNIREFRSVSNHRTQPVSLLQYILLPSAEFPKRKAKGWFLR